MHARSDLNGFIDRHCVGVQDTQFFGITLLEFPERRHAAAVTFHCQDGGPGLEDGVRQAARSRSNLVDALSLQRARYGCNPGKQLAVKDEVLTKRLARAQAVTS